MKLGKEAHISDDCIVGFVVIEDIGDAQQATFDIDRLSELGKLLKILERLGFSKITVTIENGCPMIIGGNRVGLALGSISE